MLSADQYEEKCGLGYKEEESENKDYSDRERVMKRILESKMF